MYSKSQSDARKRANNAVEGLNKSLRHIATHCEQIEGIVYGNNYVISTDKETGVLWQPQPKHLAAIELGQHTKLVRVDENLFEQVYIYIFVRASHGLIIQT